MTNTSRKILINSESAKNMFNKRSAKALITRADVGRRTIFTVSGPGNDIDVTDAMGNPVESKAEPGTVLRKRIYNVTAISEVAFNNPVVSQIFLDGLAAEAAGDVEKASDLFNSWLNKVSVSFNILHPIRAEFQALGKGDQVRGTVKMLTPEGENTKGELITLEDVTPVAVVALAGGPKLALNDLIAAFSAQKNPFQQKAVGAPAPAETES